MNLKELDVSVAEKYKGDNLILAASYSNSNSTLELVFKTRSATAKTLQFTESSNGSLPGLEEFLKLLRCKNLSSIYDISGKPSAQESSNESLWS